MELIDCIPYQFLINILSNRTDRLLIMIIRCVSSQSPNAFTTIALLQYRDEVYCMMMLFDLCFSSLGIIFLSVGGGLLLLGVPACRHSIRAMKEEKREFAAQVSILFGG